MLDGAARIGEVVARAAADGQPAIAITDHGNLYGVLDFYKECRRAGIKPIIGLEAYQAAESRFERPPRRGRLDDSGGDARGGRKLYYHLTLLAENDAGYRNLIQLSSRSFLEGYYYQPKLDWDLLEAHSDGLIATTGCLGGHVAQSLLRGDFDDALKKASRLQDIFGRDHMFVELQDHGLDEQARTTPQLIEIAERLNAPLLATNDSHYVQRSDAVAHDALLCVQTGSVMSDPDRFRFHGDEHYLKGPRRPRRRALAGEPLTAIAPIGCGHVRTRQVPPDRPRRRPAGPHPDHAGPRPPPRQRQPPRPRVPARDRDRRVRHGLLLGRRAQVLGAPGRVLHGRRLRRRLHAEPHLRGDLHRPHRPHRGRPRAFDPARSATTTLLATFWESHDPTQGMRQGNDRGTQYRSAIYATADQLRSPRPASSATSRCSPRPATARSPPRSARSEDAPFFYAEDYHQQYLAKNPIGYCGIGGTGVSCPTGL